MKFVSTANLISIQNNLEKLMQYPHNIDQHIKNLDNESVYHVHEYGIDLKANHIYLMGEDSYAYGQGEAIEEPGVDFMMANRFIRNLNLLMRKSANPIIIHMKSCGGDWAEGMAIYDTIKACPNQVTIINYTHARSMSSLIFQAADKRVMLLHSTFMLHMGSMGFGGTVKQFNTEHQQLQYATDQMLDIYVASMKGNGKFKKRSKTFIREWLIKEMDVKEEVYLNAKQAVAYGFADVVFGEDGFYNWASLLEY